jgi:hypothetical protein
VDGLIEEIGSRPSVIPLGTADRSGGVATGRRHMVRAEAVEAQTREVDRHRPRHLARTRRWRSHPPPMTRHDLPEAIRVHNRTAARQRSWHPWWRRKVLGGLGAPGVRHEIRHP